MAIPHRLPALLLAAITLVAGCGSAPETPSRAPSASPGPSAEPSATAAPADIPFAPVAWPPAGSGCLQPDWASRIGRVEALDAKTVVFTLCLPDGAFLQRLAHPAMGIVDAGDLARIAADPSAAANVVGHGGYRIVRWSGDNVELARVGASAAGATAPTVILRWSSDAAARTSALVAASVDGVDGPTAAGIDAAGTNPSLALVPRPGLATAVLGFGLGNGFSDPKVRRAFAAAVDRGSLVSAAFPAGSEAADHITPCEVPSGCAGAAYPAFNGPAALAALQAAKFNLTATYPLTVPDAPIPGLPDPAGVAAAVRDQLAASIGLTVQVATLPADQFRSAVDGGTLAGLYIDGVAAAVADPSAFLAPLLTDQPASLAARRAPGVAGSLAKAAGTADPGARNAAFAAANTSLAASVPVVPLAHTGSETIFWTDVQGAAVSPLGTDPLGAMTAGDRGQMVFMQASAPAGGWCGAQSTADAYRLCGLVTEGLYGHAGASLDPVAQLASGCTANGDASRWTCRLRVAKTPDGRVLDAADVVATFRAMADPSDPVHAALGDAAFAAWTAVFGLVPGSIPVPTPAPSASSSGSMPPSGSPAASGSPAVASPPTGAGPLTSPKP
jgi:peptide/nickel transport system substrate-binding protein